MKGKIPKKNLETAPYGKDYYKRSEFGFKSLNRMDHKRILDLIDFRGKRVLDIGCGYGSLLRLIPTEKLLKYGVESNLYAVRVCRKYGLNVIAHSQFDRLPYRSHFFDIVIMNEVIEHLSRAPLALRETKRVLRRGGLLVITTPNRNFLVNNLEKTHVAELSYKELESLASRAGFSIVAHEVSGLSLYYYLGRKLLFPIGRFLSESLVFRKHILSVRKKADTASFSKFRRNFLLFGTQQLLVAKSL